MKLIPLTLILVCMFSAFCPDEQYLIDMKTNITDLRESQNTERLQVVLEKLQQIAQNEPDEWLPSYYIALTQLKIAENIEDKTNLEQYFEEARTGVSNALDQFPTESELMALLAMVYIEQCQGKPVEDYENDMMIAQQLLSDAIQIDPNNPRTYYLMGKSIYEFNKKMESNTGESCEYFNQATDRFSSYEPSSELHPNWGSDQNMRLLASCKGSRNPEKEERK